ncbi:MAG: glycosyltransferase family 2 protein [Phycisphaerales bacterium]|nr:glycosyltransferase family 2 protein [Phycisphaerales bacterium]
MVRLSVIAIARNEERRIGRMLDSVRFADELIVVDGGSEDSTVDVAISRGAKVHVHPDWQGFGVQRNRALGYATGDWVLSLDCDEWVTPELGAEIAQAMGRQEVGAFRIPRASFMCGKRIHHCGWWPDHVVRLFRRGTPRFSDDLVHERLIPGCAVGTLSSPLMHETHRSVEEAIAKMNRYSTEGAVGALGRGRRGGVTIGAARGMWMFLRTYLLRLGVLDGREGLMISVLNAEATFWRYAKMGIEASPPGGRSGLSRPHIGGQ